MITLFITLLSVTTLAMPILANDEGIQTLDIKNNRPGNEE